MKRVTSRPASNHTPTPAPLDTIVIPPAWQYDPSRAGGVAVLSGDLVSVYPGNDRRIPQASVTPSTTYLLSEQDTLLSLAQLLRDMKISVLLLHVRESAQDAAWVRDWRGTVENLCALAPSVDMLAQPIGTRDLSGQLSGLLLRPLGGGQELSVYYLGGGDVWGLADYLGLIDAEDSIHRAQALANAWLLAQWALGLRVRYTPSYVGLLAMRVSLAHAVTLAEAKNPRRFAPLSESWQETLRELAADYCHWFQPETGYQLPGVKGQSTVHVWSYDRNWSFVSSARRVPLGTPELVTRYDKRPGVYLVSAKAPEPESGRMTPGYFRAPDGSYPSSVAKAWVWEPQLAAAIRAGWRVEVLRGYAFPDAYDLRPWHDLMWKARKAVRAARAHSHSTWQTAATLGAEQLIKRAGVSGIGRLNQHSGRVVSWSGAGNGLVSYRMTGASIELAQAEMRAQGRDMARPEWWSSIISSASERLITLLRAYGGLALGGYIDAGYFITELPELTARSQDPGGWHLEANGVMLPAEALRGNLTEFVGAVARAKRAQGVPHAN